MAKDERTIARETEERARQWNNTKAFFNGAFRALVAIVVIGALNFGISRLFPGPPPSDLTTKIKSLTDALNSSAKTISEIEKEIDERKTLVERLQKDADIAKKLAGVSKEQADAVAQALRSTLENQERSSFWVNQFQNLLYTCLGVVLAELYHWWKRKFGRAETS